MNIRPSWRAGAASLMLLLGCGGEPPHADEPGPAHPFVGERALTAATAEGPAWLELGEDRLSFGTIAEGENPVHRVWFRNAGGEPLRITGVTRACSCTRTTLRRVEGDVERGMAIGESLPPAAIGALDVEILSVGHPGEHDLVVSLSSDAPEHPTAKATLRGTILTLFAVDPPTLLAQLPALRGGVLEAEVRSKDSRDFELVGMRSGPAGLQVDTAPAEGEGRRRVRFHFEGERSEGVVQTPVVLELRCADGSIRPLSVPLRVVFGGALELDPPALDLGRWDPGTAQQGTLIVRNHDPRHTLALTGLRCLSSRGEHLSTRVEEHGAQELRIHVEIAADCPEGNLSGSLSFETGLPGQGRQRVPFSGLIALPPPEPEPKEEVDTTPVPIEQRRSIRTRAERDAEEARREKGRKGGRGSGGSGDSGG